MATHLRPTVVTVLVPPRTRHTPATPAVVERAPVLTAPRAPRQLPLFGPRRG